MKALVFIETKDGAPVGGSLELFGAAASIGAEAEGIVIGDEAVAKAAADAVGASVSYVEADDCEDVITDVVAKAAAGADVVFVAATPTGKVVAPRIGARLDAGVVNDITGISADDGILITRPAFGGSILEQIKIKTPVAVVSVRPGSFEKPAAAAGTAAKSAIEAAAAKTQLVEHIAEQGEVVNIEDADIIVAGGRGMGSAEEFAKVIDLAEALGGAVGASRPAIEAGWMPRQHQVGQSGKIVAPKLYVVAGVSGATQHVAGMSGSKYVLAINTDEDAQIFEVADLGIVGDAKKILPLLTEAVKNR